MTDRPAAHIAAVQSPASLFRRVAETLGADTGIIGPGDFAVTEDDTPGLLVKIAAGSAWIIGAEAFQGAYLVEMTADETRAVAAGDATNPRIDLVGVQVRDAEAAGFTENDWELIVVTGVAEASPSRPATPDSFLELAELTIPAGASQVTNADVTADLRPVWAGAGGGEWGVISQDGSSQSIGGALTRLNFPTVRGSSVPGVVATAHRLICTIGGLFEVATHVPTQDGRAELLIRLNGSGGIGQISGDGEAATGSIDGSVVVDLTPGDYVECWANNSATTANIGGATNGYSGEGHLMMRRLGASA